MPVFFSELDFNSIINMDIIGQMKYELLEVEYFIHIYFLPFILLVLLLLVAARTTAGSCPLQPSVDVHFRELLISSEQSPC